MSSNIFPSKVLINLKISTDNPGDSNMYKNTTIEFYPTFVDKTLISDKTLLHKSIQSTPQDFMRLYDNKSPTNVPDLNRSGNILVMPSIRLSDAMLKKTGSSPMQVLNSSTSFIQALALNNGIDKLSNLDELGKNMQHNLNYIVRTYLPDGGTITIPHTITKTPETGTAQTGTSQTGTSQTGTAQTGTAQTGTAQTGNTLLRGTNKYKIMSAKWMRDKIDAKLLAELQDRYNEVNIEYKNKLKEKKLLDKTASLDVQKKELAENNTLLEKELEYYSSEYENLKDMFVQLNTSINNTDKNNPNNEEIKNLLDNIKQNFNIENYNDCIKNIKKNTKDGCVNDFNTFYDNLVDENDDKTSKLEDLFVILKKISDKAKSLFGIYIENQNIKEKLDDIEEKMDKYEATYININTQKGLLNLKCQLYEIQQLIDSIKGGWRIDNTYVSNKNIKNNAIQKSREAVEIAKKKLDNAKKELVDTKNKSKMLGNKNTAITLQVYKKEKIVDNAEEALTRAKENEEKASEDKKIIIGDINCQDDKNWYKLSRSGIRYPKVYTITVDLKLHYIGKDDHSILSSFNCDSTAANLDNRISSILGRPFTGLQNFIASYSPKASLFYNLYNFDNTSAESQLSSQRERNRAIMQAQQLAQARNPIYSVPQFGTNAAVQSNTATNVVPTVMANVVPMGMPTVVSTGMPTVVSTGMPNFVPNAAVQSNTATNVAPSDFQSEPRYPVRARQPPVRFVPRWGGKNNKKYTRKKYKTSTKKKTINSKNKKRTINYRPKQSWRNKLIKS